MDAGTAEKAQTGNCGPVILDIGGGRGALVVACPAAMRGVELEVSPRHDPRRRTHVWVLERQAGAGSVIAAVFASLDEGVYTVWGDEHGAVRCEALVVGGRVTTIDLEDMHAR